MKRIWMTVSRAKEAGKDYSTSSVIKSEVFQHVFVQKIMFTLVHNNSFSKLYNTSSLTFLSTYVVLPTSLHNLKPSVSQLNFCPMF